MNQTASTTATDGAADGTVTGAVLASWTANRGPGPLIVDVRSAAEFDALHVRGSYHVPLPTLAEHTAELAAHLSAAEPVVLVCQSGVRAEQARRRLTAAGLTGARVLDGGVSAFASAGGQVVHGRSAWALERQVRLVAGALVLGGLIGGRLVSPRVRLLAAGIGAGLAVSALTDTCAMAAALAHMPWNRDHTDPQPSDTLDRVAGRNPQG